MQKTSGNYTAENTPLIPIVYVLFREHVGESEGVSMPCVNCTVVTEDNLEELEVFKKDIIDFLNFFAYESTQFVYDSANLNAFVCTPISLPQNMESGEPLYPMPDVVFRSQIKIAGMTDWTDFSFDTSGKVTYLDNDITSCVLGRIVNHVAIDNKEARAVILNLGAFYEKCKELTAKHAYQGEIRVPVVEDKKSLHAWLSENRCPRRIYCYNEKHGDDKHESQNYTNRKGQSIKAAQLETNFEDTDSWLALAIGDDLDSELWYWDAGRGKFIYFENQNTTPVSYHAYHLVKGDKNFENINVNKLREIQDIPKK